MAEWERGKLLSLPDRPRLVGKVHKVLRLKPYAHLTIERVVERGGYQVNFSGMVKCWKGRFVLAEPTEIHLIEFDRESVGDEPRAWFSTNGYEPMTTVHLFGIGIQHPDEQRCRRDIFELGTVRENAVLFLSGGPNYRTLNEYHAKGVWMKRFLFGAIKVAQEVSNGVICDFEP